MKKTKIAAVLAACAIAVSGCGVGSSATVITVGDTKVSGGALNFYITELMNAGSSFDEYKEQAAQSLEDMLKMVEVGKAWGFNLSDEEKEDINTSLIRMRQQMGGKKEFDKLTKQYGVTDEFVKDLLSASTYQNKIKGAVDVPELTDEDIKQYYMEHYLRAKHVLITTKDMTTGEEKDAEAAKATAEEVLAKAQAGEDFDALIAEYNEDPGADSNPNGYVFTDGEMVAEFENKVKELSPGEIGMCETSYGYHVIKRLALDETPELFDELFEENKSTVSSTAKQAKLDEAIDRKAEEYSIKCEINEDAVKKLKAISTPEPESK